MNDRTRFLVLHLSSLLVTLAVLVAFDAFDVRLLFFVGFVGYLFSLEATAPTHGTSRWRRRLRFVTAAWALTYAFIVTRYFLDILNRI
ncbi:hypothetical protein [Halogeometricum limi]|uniref:Uncharacterized protein n=1 Tax=Halogeometricum limi TaxID=555875 RepID=A0A1I6IJZ3_9EURY|nr:hypothetical protein [Halogeometricum limi]SFR67008.1 hypothetical protein SAMN04488124_3311 [Halogeometricum limi]